MSAVKSWPAIAISSGNLIYMTPAVQVKPMSSATQTAVNKPTTANTTQAGFAFVQALGVELSSGELELPAFPDIALRVKDVLEKPDVSAEQVAMVVSSEPVLSARLLKVANSAAYPNRSGEAVKDVRTAITRLGFTMARNTAAAIAMEQLMAVNNNGDDTVRTHMENLWQHSLEVAALSQVLAKKLTRLKPDEAMLAGLLHDIGKLYILSRSRQHPGLFAHPTALEEVLENWHTGVGSAILQAWNFDEAFVIVADEHEIIERSHVGSADLTDVVIVANLLAHAWREEQNLMEWTSFPAMERLHLTAANAEEILVASEQEVISIMQALGGG